MSDKRVFCGSIRVKIDTESYLLELADAPLHGGESGLFRVREARRWLDGFYSKAGLVKIIEEKFCNNYLDDKPDLKARDDVRVYYEHDDIEFHRTFLSADPILTYEGVWVCPVFIYNLGVVYVNCDHIQLRRRMT